MYRPFSSAAAAMLLSDSRVRELSPGDVFMPDTATEAQVPGLSVYKHATGRSRSACPSLGPCW